MKKTLLLLATALLAPLMAAAQEMYAVFDGDVTLTFYYDNKKSTRSGDVYAISNTPVDVDKFLHQDDLSDSEVEALMATLFPAWTRTDAMAYSTKVVFHSSFAAARPVNLSSWFGGFESLTTIQGLQYLNTSQTTSMWCMFTACPALTSLNLSTFDTGKVQTFSNMFDGCSSLTSLNLSGWNTQSARMMDYMFSECSKLTSLDVSSFDTRNVTTMEKMFYDCSKVTSLDVSGFDTRNVTTTKCMFENCSALTSLDLRSFSMSKVENCASMFTNCTNLKTIYCNSDWTGIPATKKTKGTLLMFQGCNSLVGGKGTKCNGNSEWNEPVNHEYARPDGGESKKGYFTRVLVSDPAAGYAVFNEDLGTLTFYFDSRINDRDGDIYGMGYAMNEYYGEETPEWTGELTWEVYRVIFDESYSNARPKRMDYWFSELPSLLSIEGLEYLNTSAVTTMKGLFNGCTSLNYVDLSRFNTSAVTDMSSMFAETKGLFSVDLTHFDMTKVKDVTRMFYDTSLHTIYCNTNWTSANGINFTASDDLFLYSIRLAGPYNAYDTEKADAGLYDNIKAARVDSSNRIGFFTTKEPTGSGADVNGDGKVDVGDVNAVIKAIKEANE